MLVICIFISINNYAEMHGSDHSCLILHHVSIIRWHALSIKAHLTQKLLLNQAAAICEVPIAWGKFSVLWISIEITGFCSRTFTKQL